MAPYCNNFNESKTGKGNNNELINGKESNPTIKNVSVTGTNQFQQL